MAILNSKLRQPLFIEFMRQRQVSDIKLNEQLLNLISSHVEKIKQLKPTAIVVIPSQTWRQRQSMAEFLARLFDIPVYLNCLKWLKLPEYRQGELLNNDQRRFNVKHNMTANFEQTKPTGNIILFDDYIGSNATMKEAARALIKDAGFTSNIIPLTIAAITWRLGQSGMI
jgi:ATP-dependent DNA helicase RecQ